MACTPAAFRSRTTACASAGVSGVGAPTPAPKTTPLTVIIGPVAKKRANGAVSSAAAAFSAAKSFSEMEGLKMVVTPTASIRRSTDRGFTIGAQPPLDQVMVHVRQAGDDELSLPVDHRCPRRHGDRATGADLTESARRR